MLDRKTPPAIGDIGVIKLIDPQVIELENGVRIYSIYGDRDDVCRISALVEGGSYDVEPCQDVQVMARMLREGTLSMSSSEVADLLDYNGVACAAVARNHYTLMHLLSLSHRFDAVLPTFFDMLVNPSFPEHETTIAAEMMARQLEVEQKKVSFQANVAITRLYAGATHPAAIIPTPEQVKGVTPERLRALHKQMLNPRKLRVYLAGKVTPEMLGNVVEAFSAIKTDAPGIEIDIKPFLPMGESRVHVDVADSKQNAVSMAIPAIPRDNPDYIPLRIAVMMLGGYFGSRLMTNLREDKGYTYSVTASLLGQPEGGVIKIDTQCDKRYTAQVIDQIKHEMEMMWRKPADSDEMLRLRRHYMTSLAPRAESPINMIDEAMAMLTTACPEGYFTQQQEVLASITAADLQRVSKEYFNFDKLKIATAGQE